MQGAWFRRTVGWMPMCTSCTWVEKEWWTVLWFAALVWIERPDSVQGHEKWIWHSPFDKDKVDKANMVRVLENIRQNMLVRELKHIRVFTISFNLLGGETATQKCIGSSCVCRYESIKHQAPWLKMWRMLWAKCPGYCANLARFRSSACTYHVYSFVFIHIFIKLIRYLNCCTLK